MTGFRFVCRFEKVGHSIPGSPDLSSDDALDVDSFEDDGVHVDRLVGVSVDAEEADPEAWASAFDGEIEGGRVAGHLKGGVDASRGFGFDSCADVAVVWREDHIGADLFSQADSGTG